MLVVITLAWAFVLMSHARPKVRGGRNSIIFLAIYAIPLTFYAGTKHAWKFTFDTGLHDNGSYVTNTTVCAAWTHDLTVLDGDTLYVDYRPVGTTNEWIMFFETTVGSNRVCGELTNATNMEFYVYSEYLPPSPVVTNGIYHLSGFDRPSTNAYVTVQVIIKGNSVTIAPIREDQ